jgi:hypothetical protein
LTWLSERFKRRLRFKDMMDPPEFESRIS